MPNQGRPPHARSRTRDPRQRDDLLWSWHEPEGDGDETEIGELDPDFLGPPTRICPRCSAQTATDSLFCPHCHASYRRRRPPRMSRRTKLVRRLVPTLLVLIGGVAAGTAIGTSAHTPKKHVAAIRPVSHTQPQTVTHQVEINSQSETNQTDTQIAAVAQILADTTTINETYLLPADTTSSGDPSNSSSSSATDVTTASDGSAPVDTTTTGDSTTPTDTTATTTGPTASSDDDLDGDGCSDSYDSTACVPPYAGVDDVNCSDLSDTDFASTGNDPYRLDADNDGIACES